MGKLFNDLAYGTYIPTYAGLPLEAAQRTADVLENRHWTNKETYDRTEIALANLNLHEKDEAIRKDAEQNLNATMSGIIDSNNWENASMITKNAAKDVALNRGLMEAVKSNQSKQAQITAAQERVGKGEDENGILQEDVDFVKGIGEQSYKGVYKDETTGAWKGHWSMSDIPKYINIGARADKFLAELKPDTYIGRQMVTEPERAKDGGIAKDKDGNTVYGELTSRVIQKTEDGRYIWVEERKTADGSYIYMPSTEEATYEQVYNASRAYIMQSEDVDERLNFDIKKDQSTFSTRADIEGTASARKAIINDLKLFGGYSDESLKGLSNDVLYEMHKKEGIIHEAITGPTIKHSYVKETAQMFGLTLEAQLKKQKRKNAKGRGGDDKTPEKDHYIHYGLTAGYKSTGKPYSVEEYNTALNTAQTSLNTQDKEVATIAEKIANIEKKGGVVDEALRAQYERALAHREKYANSITELNQWFNYAFSEISEKYGDEVLEGYKKEYVPVVEDSRKLFNGLLELVENPDEPYMDMTMAAFTGGVGIPTWTSPVTGETKAGTRKEYLQDQFEGWLKNGTFEVGVGGGTGTIMTLTNYLKESSGDITAALAHADERMRNVKQKYQPVANDLDAIMQEKAENRTTDYAYVDLSIPSKQSSNSGNQEYSDFSKSATAYFQNNPNNFILINTDGEEVLWENNNESEYYKKPNIVITGYTVEPVGQHGYGVIAKEILKDDDGNEIGQRQHIFKTKTNDGTIRQLAANELRFSLLDKDGIPREGIDFEHSNEIIELWEKDEVDKQLAIFQDYPAIPVTSNQYDSGKRYNELQKEIFIGSRYRAVVNRRTDVSGNNYYDVTYIDRTNGDARRVDDYPNLFEVQRDMENLTSQGSYNIPLSELKKIYAQDFNYGKLGKNVVAPYIHNDMYNEIKGLEVLARSTLSKNPYVISSMLESQRQGKDNEQALAGRAITIENNPQFLEWLKSNSRNNKINNTNLRYEVSTKGGKPYIMLKMTTDFKLPTKSFNE
jgi:hypothetical protein